jgi:hypothetical protein
MATSPSELSTMGNAFSPKTAKTEEDLKDELAKFKNCHWIGGWFLPRLS